MKFVKALVLAMASIFVSQLSIAQLPPPVDPDCIDVVGQDFQGNVTATDRFWFYKNTDGTARPAGGGQYPSVEWSTDGNNTNDPNNAVYVRGSSVVVDANFYLETGNTNALVGYLDLVSAEYIVGSTTYNLSVSGSGSITIAHQGTYTTKTITLSGFPNFVAKGTLRISGRITLTQPYNNLPSGSIVFGNATTPE